MTKQKNIIVETISDLSSLRVGDGDYIELLGYYSVGDGGGQLLQYDKDSSATVDNGFVFNGPSSIGRYLAVDTKKIKIKRFGVLADGITNDGPFLVEALDAAAEEIDLQGLTIRIDNDVSTSNYNSIRNGTILALSNGSSSLSFSNGAEFNNVVFDSQNNGGVIRQVVVGGNALASFHNCIFKNHRSNSNALCTVITASHCHISSCTYSGIGAVGTGTESDASGIVRGIYFGAGSNPLRHGLVENCIFHGLNTISGNGEPMFEDADAVSTEAGGTAIPRVLTVQGCSFINVGKRAVKFQGTNISGHVLNFRDSYVRSSWTRGNPDDGTDRDDGMYAVVSVGAGRCHVDNIVLEGGPSRYFCSIESNCHDCTITNCKSKMEPARFVQGSDTAFVVMTANVLDSCRLSCSNNSMYGTTYGAYILGGKGANIHNNNISTFVFGASIGSSLDPRFDLVMTGNSCSPHQYYTASSSRAFTLIGTNSLHKANISNNIMPSGVFVYGIRLLEQTSSDWYLTGIGNYFNVVSSANALNVNTSIVNPERRITYKDNFPRGDFSKKWRDMPGTSTVGEVDGGENFYINGKNNLTIITGGYDGQTITLFCSGNLDAIASTTNNISLAGGANLVPTVNTYLTLKYDATGLGDWYELSRSESIP